MYNQIPLTLLYHTHYMASEGGHTITFSKSRICYLENSGNTLTNKPEDLAKLTVQPQAANAANPSMRVATFPASMHGWHQLPVNNYGLYTTFNELLSLFENTDSFKPVAADVSISHAIPLAKYPAPNAGSGLSFNNTIYAMIYDLYDTDWVQAKKPFPTQDEAIIFFKSFDGMSYKDNKRVLLPKNDILFKFPYTYDTENTAQDSAKPEVRYTYPKNNDGKPAQITPQADQTNQPLTLDEVKERFIPEFLSDNKNVKILYPGENIDSYHYEDGNRFGEVDCAGLQYGEAFQSLDARNFTMNAPDNRTYDKMLLTMPCFPNVKGPHFNSESAGMARNPKELLSRLLCDETHSESFGKSMPEKFIKGLPILGIEDDIITHMFNVVITHTITIEIKPRQRYIPRPLQYGYVLPYREKVLVASNTYATRQVMKEQLPIKPYRTNICSDFKKRLRPIALSSSTTESFNEMYNINELGDESTLLDGEIPHERFGYATNLNIPTKSFLQPNDK